MSKGARRKGGLARESDIPEQRVLIRNSENDTYKKCRQAWHWAYRKRLTSKRPKTALFFGDLVHRALAERYPKGRKRGPHPAKVLSRLYREYREGGGQEITMKLDEDSGEMVTAEDLGVEMMNNYVKFYGKDERYEVIAPEMSFQVDVFDPKTGLYVYTQVGTIDLVVKDLLTGEIGTVEHKTGAGLTPFGAPEELDEQSGTYWTFGPDWLRHHGWLKKGQDLDFLMFNRMKKAFADQRPTNAEGHALNKDGSVSKRQPPPLFRRSMVYRSEEDRRRMLRRKLAEAKEMALVREGRLPVYKNPDRHCGYCEFRDMCEVHETGSDWRAIRATTMTSWDPYEDHGMGVPR